MICSLRLAVVLFRLVESSESANYRQGGFYAKRDTAASGFDLGGSCDAAGFRVTWCSQRGGAGSAESGTSLSCVGQASKAVSGYLCSRHVPRRGSSSA